MITERIYYTASLKNIGVNLNKSTYEKLNSNSKEDITTKLEAYFYKNKIEATEKIIDVSTSNNFFSPKEKGFYLITFDKKTYDNKILVSKPILIYYDGSNQNIKVKSELIDKDKLNPISPDIGDKNDNQVIDNNYIKNNKKNYKKLPQTGLLWWPVGVLVGLGIFFFMLSLRNKYE